MQDSSNATPAEAIVIETTRFGPIEVDSDRVIHFAHGLLGFPEARRFALIQTDAGDTLGDPSADEATADCFYWLQSADDPRLAFVVCDPSGFLPEFADYSAGTLPLRGECREELGFDAEDREAVDGAQVLVICNRVGEWITGNLLGPLVINGETFKGKQVVLTERKWGTRHPLLRLGVAETASTSTAGRIEPATGAAERPLRKTA